MAEDSFTPRSLRRKASVRLAVAAVLIAVVAGIGLYTSLDVFAMLGAGAVFAIYLLVAACWQLRRDAKILEGIHAEPLAIWSFSPFQWKARMKREADHARRPRWVVPVVAAVLGAAAVPFLTDAEHASNVIYGIFALLAFAVVAYTVGTRRTQRLRAARGRVVIAARGATVGEQLVDWGVYGQLISIAFDESRQALVVRHRVRFRRGRRRFDVNTLVPVPDTERSKALELVLRLSPVHQ